MGSRNDQTQQEYEKFRNDSNGTCSFCSLVVEPTRQIIATYEHMLLIQNRFPYTTWDNTPVTTHLMIIPKRHILYLDDFTSEERSEYGTLLAQAEKEGYSIYHRSQHNKNRTMLHLHTHLFRLTH